MIDVDETNRDRLCNAIEQYIIGKKGERNRNILYMHLIDGKTAEEIAEIFDMSSRQIYRIFSKCETKLIGKI